MAIVSADVAVTDRWFGITEHGELDLVSGDWANGLIRVMSVGARVHTGIDIGPVRVTVDTHDTPPDRIDDSLPWDEIVEVSLAAPLGELRVDSPQTGPVMELPPLTPHGPGTYRLRIHARGRDASVHTVQGDLPPEEYLLTSWPAVPSPELVIRLTDQCGYSRRLSHVKSSASHPYREPPQVAAQRQRQAQLHQSILQGIAEQPSTTTPPTSSTPWPPPPAT